MAYVRATNLTKNSGSVDRSSKSSYVVYRQDPPAAATVYATSDQASSLEDKEWWTGWKIRDFHRRVRSGELLPHTPFNKFSVYGTCVGSADYWIEPSNPKHYWTTGNYCPEDSSAWLPTQEEVRALCPPLTDRYVNEAAAKIYSKGWDALTFLAEITSLRKQFLNAAHKLSRIRIPKNLKKWSKRKIKSVEDIQRNFWDLPGTWLESRYAWRTLLYDIDDICKQAAGLADKRKRHSERVGESYTSQTSRSVTTGYTHFYATEVWVDLVEVSLRGSVTADIEVPQVQFNPAQTIWELVPLSFVVDWFVTVGKSLSAASFLWRQNNYAASKGIQCKLTRTYTREISEGKSTFISGNSSWTATATGTWFERQPCPVPLTPHTTLQLNTFKVLDLLAIGEQRAFRR